MADIYDPETENKGGTGNSSQNSHSPSPSSNSTAPGSASFSQGDSLDPVRQHEKQGNLWKPDGDTAGNGSGGLTDSTDAKDGGSTSSTRDSPNEGLRNQEKNGGSNNNETGGNDEKSEEGDGLYNDDDQPQGRFSQARAGVQNARRGLGRLTGNRWLVGIVAGIGVALTGLAILLVFLIGALKIPDFIQNVTAYQFNRVTSEYAESTEDVASEDLAVQSAKDILYSQLQDSYQNLRGNTWGKLDTLRPGVIINNLATDNKLQFNYQSSGILGRQELAGITLNNQTYLVKDVSGPWKYIPAANQIIDFKNQVDLANQFFPDLSAGMQLDNVNPLVRGLVANSLRKEAGISLVAWAASTLSTFNNEPPNTADILEARNAYDAIDQEAQAAKIPVTIDLREATIAAEQQEKTDVASNSALEKILAKGGVDPAVSAILQKSLSSNALTTALSAVNPVVAYGMPLCIIYDGSLENSGPTIDEQTTEEERSYYYVASAADQQKAGQVNGEAVGALNDQLGDITQSNAEIRASGGVPNTDNTLSTEASADGQYTILNALGIAPSVLDPAANTICPVITSTGGIIGLSILQLIVALATGGSSVEAEEGVGTTAESTLGSFAQNFLSRFTGTTTSKVGGKIGDIISDTVSTGAKIAGATIAAKLIVMADSGNLHNGLEQGTDLTNEVDAGGNYTANQLDQNLNYGRPMTTDEALQSDQQTNKDLADQTKTESAYDRYASIANPSSLVSRLVIMSSAYLTPKSLPHFGNLLADLLAPFHAMGNLVTSFNTNLAFAAANPGVDNSDYGNVQFGWSQAEESLINSDPSYHMLENQLILDDSGQEDSIASTYGICFTDSIGTLLANQDIVRDQNGNVSPTDGQCAPCNLTFNGNPECVAAGDSNNDPGDLVFRWRLMNRYNNGLDQLSNEQTIGSSDTTSSTSGTGTGSTSISTPVTTAASGDGEQLAKQILANKSISLEGTDVSQDVEAAANGQPGTAGVLTSSAILKLIATVGQSHSTVITAIQSGGTGHCIENGVATPKSACPNDPHYNGDAVDFGSLDGTLITGRNPPALTIMSIAESVLPTGSGFGQSECGDTPTLPAGWTTFPDTCNHLHVQVPAGTP